MKIFTHLSGHKKYEEQKGEWLITDTLPIGYESQVLLQISYFLYNCKKGQTPKKVLPF